MVTTRLPAPSWMATRRTCPAHSGSDRGGLPDWPTADPREVAVSGSGCRNPSRQRSIDIELLHGDRIGNCMERRRHPQPWPTDHDYCTVSSNLATNEQGTASYGGIVVNALTTLTDCRIIGNQSDAFGGGLWSVIVPSSPWQGEAWSRAIRRPLAVALA